MPDRSPTLRIGTRGSRLALAQANMVAGLLRGIGAASEIVVLKTTGDRIVDRPLADAGGKGLFVKELEDALLNDAIDLAVHSMKDVPVDLPPGLDIAAILKRENPCDALVMPEGKTTKDLVADAHIGTSSVRREAQVRRAHPGSRVSLLRGNVDTRLAKLDSGMFDAILLAYAGLRRLGLDSRATSVLSSDLWLPALAQGAIGIETRKEDRAGRVVDALNHPDTFIAVSCERGFQAGLGGSCRSPIAGLAEVLGDTLTFRGEVIAPDGSDSVPSQFQVSTLAQNFRESATYAAHEGFQAGQFIRKRAQKWLDL